MTYRQDLQIIILLTALCGDELAVHARDIGHLDVLRTLSRTCAGVGAVAEAELIHLGNHGERAAVTLHSALRKAGELTDLGRYEKHRGAVLAGCHAGTAADAARGVHGLVGLNLRDRKIVGILCAAAVERHIAAGLLDLVERVTVYHEVLDNRESCRTPGLYGDGLAVSETTHIELAGGRAGGGTVGMSVDIERAHAADTLAAVVVEHNRLLAFLDKSLVENVESLEE